MKAVCHAVIVVALSVAALGPGEAPLHTIPAPQGTVSASGPTVATGASHRFLVRFEETVSNPTDAALRDLVCTVALPYEAPRQRVRWMRFSPHAWELSTDAQGQRVATARLPELAPGDAVTFAWLASVDLSRSHHRARAEPSRRASVDVRSRYLRDDPVLRLASDEVRAAEQIVRRRSTSDAPRDLARAAFGFVRRRVRYERVGGWDDAATVLGRGSGSCSEATYAYVAICRRLGIPTRWTGGTVLRSGPPGRPVDEVFHRIAEVHLPGHGWLPVDPSVPAEEDDGSAWAGTHRGFLLLARGDNGPGSALGASYTARCRWTEDGAAPGAPRGRARRRFFWVAGVPDAWAREGALSDLPAGRPPTYARAELLRADADGFGPALTTEGRPAFPGVFGEGVATAGR